MRVAIVHYHYRRGGVTRVVDTTLRALQGVPEAPSVVALSGSLPGSDAIEGSVSVSGLGYTTGAERTNPGDLLEALDRTAATALGGPPDLWHFHNHSLGKNGGMLEVVRRLAERGDPLLLQIHDFAEDGRPSNLAYRNASSTAPEPSLPVRPGIHYGVLNRRDADFLARAEVPAHQIHCLANPVEAPPFGPAASDPEGKSNLILYPVRALRRKNLGEFLLLAASDREGHHFATSLGPTNPAYQNTYRNWIQLADELGLPAEFGINEKANRAFAELITGAKAVVTTSVAEGFGMTFLEPWLFNRPVTGRELPGITDDFSEVGVRLPGLYREIPVPHEILDREGLCRRYTEALFLLAATYRRPWRAADAEGFFERWYGNQTVDYGKLDETEQTRLLRHGFRCPTSPLEALETLTDRDLIASNRATILKGFGPARYATRLLAIWKAIATEGVPGAVPTWGNSEALLDAFTDPVRLSLLRT